MTDIYFSFIILVEGACYTLLYDSDLDEGVEIDLTADCENGNNENQAKAKPAKELQCSPRKPSVELVEKLKDPIAEKFENLHSESPAGVNLFRFYLFCRYKIFHVLNNFSFFFFRGTKIFGRMVFTNTRKGSSRTIDSINQGFLCMSWEENACNMLL